MLPTAHRAVDRAQVEPGRVPMHGPEMRTDTDQMHLGPATVTSLVLAAASLAALWLGRGVDALALAGAVGLVIAASLLGLTLLAWRWSSRQRAYVRTAVERAADAAQVDEAASGERAVS
jgi:hypothetical protein